MIQEQTSAVLSALRTLANERKGLESLEEAIRTQRDGELGVAFSEAVKTIAAAPGRVIVTGIGKSGLIARKIAATLASTGEPAFFVHPAEASHGDLGMVQIGDVVLAISWSGETAELAAIVTFAKRYAIPLIAMTAEANSALGREADVCLTMPNAPEACPNGLAPTTSTTMQLVLGDALAIALLEGRGFTALDFRALHPGGKLGAKLMRVREVMHTGDRIPRIEAGARMAEAICAVT
jgi:arabinose-5-phosphate isomerase